MCETIDEIFEVIIEIFEYKKAYIKNEQNKVFIYLTISLLYGKEKEIKLELQKKNSNINIINEEVCNKIINLENEINEVKNENKKNLEKINNLEIIILL